MGEVLTLARSEEETSRWKRQHVTDGGDEISNSESKNIQIFGENINCNRLAYFWL